MKATDLMIGDWVKTPIELGKVMAITATALPGFQTIEVWHRHRDPDGIKQPADYIGEVGNLQPIPLTPEILEKNGFKKQAGEVWEYDIFSKDKSLASMIVWRRDYATPRLTIHSFVLQYGTYSRRDIKYIHEFQHALRLCGIEKEVLV